MITTPKTQMDHAYYAPDTRSRFQRLTDRLFPALYCETPEPDWMGHGDVVFTEVGIGLSFADRLRVLWRGRIRVKTRTVCEHHVGRAISHSVLYPVWKHPEESR